MPVNMACGERNLLHMRRLPLQQSRRLTLRPIPKNWGWSRALRLQPAFPADAGHQIFRASPVSPGCLARRWDEQSYRQLLSEWASSRQRRQRARTRRA